MSVFVLGLALDLGLGQNLNEIGFACPEAMDLVIPEFDLVVAVAIGFGPHLSPLHLFVL